MDGKLTVTELAQILVRESQMNQASAEAFVKAVFDIVTEAVLSDKIVKVKGLGTFKLIGVSDRESVNVNTGERILIAGHSKLSFTPDVALKNAVNRPFADFETVILNENTPIDEMERMADEGQVGDVVTEGIVGSVTEGANAGAEGGIDADVPQPVCEPEVVQDEVVTDQNAVSAESEVTVSQEPEESVEPVSQEPEESVEPVSQESEESVEPEESGESEESVEPEESGESEVSVKSEESVKSGIAGNGSLHGWIWACVTLCVAVGAYFLGYYRVLSGITIKIERQEVVTKHEEPVKPVVKKKPVVKTESSQKNVANESKDSVVSAIRDSVAAASKPAAPKPAEPKPEVLARKYKQVEGGDYWIVGDMGVVHEMKVGETLYKVAGKELGSQKLMPYLVVFNDFEDPNLIRIGDPIRIPKLVRKY